jgi:hypothetical protein
MIKRIWRKLKSLPKWTIIPVVLGLLALVGRLVGRGLSPFWPLSSPQSRPTTLLSDRDIRESRKAIEKQRSVRLKEIEAQTKALRDRARKKFGE